MPCNRIKSRDLGRHRRGRRARRSLPHPARRRGPAGRPGVRLAARRRVRRIGGRRRGPVGVDRRELVAGRPRGRRALRAARRDVHTGGHARRRRRGARSPRRPRRHPRGADAAQPVRRRPQLGLRRRLLVRRAGHVRRSGGAGPLRRRRPRRRARGGPGRRLQPRRPARQRHARVRAVLHRHGAQPVGRGRQRRWTGQRRGSTHDPRERGALDRGLPRRRPARRRHPRHPRPDGATAPRAADHRGPCRRRRGRTAGPPHRRELRQRPARRETGRHRRARLRRRVGRRPPPRPARRLDRRPARLLRRLRRRARPRHGAGAALALRRPLVARPRADARPPGRRCPRIAVRRVHEQPRPRRQHPGRRSSAVRRPPTTAGGGDRAALAVHPDAVHGRGVRRPSAVPVLRRPRRPGAVGSDPGGPSPRVPRRMDRRGGGRPGRPGDVPARRARSVIGREGGAPAGARGLHRAAGPTAPPRGAARRRRAGRDPPRRRHRAGPPDAPAPAPSSCWRSARDRRRSRWMARGSPIALDTATWIPTAPAAVLGVGGLGVDGPGAVLLVSG